MSRPGPIVLPPTRADVAVARVCARHVNPPIGRVLQTASWMADEKAVLAAAALVLLASRRGNRAVRREAEVMLVSVLVAGAVPHLFKWSVRRRRPDRSVAGRHRRGIPRSGNAYNSFPSGHAIHMGAMVGSAARLAPRGLAPVICSALAALAATRVALLAHYPSDVLAGWGLGLVIRRAVGAIWPRSA